mmetsp:Transcript_15284/g.25405  ORF Transcript_15284/g.25405 Transcript_15284/m.25405 type:complete len:97 (-) Transcript_15284:71-361(-)
MLKRRNTGIAPNRDALLSGIDGTEPAKSVTSKKSLFPETKLGSEMPLESGPDKEDAAVSIEKSWNPTEVLGDFVVFDRLNMLDKDQSRVSEVASTT